MLVTSCEKDQCLTCNTYNLMEFTGEIESFYGTFFVCESDDMWDDIVWGEYNDGVGGDFSFIDLNLRVRCCSIFARGATPSMAIYTSTCGLVIFTILTI